MMNRFKVFVEFEVRDKKGKVIHRHRQRSHSWVRNAYNAMFTSLAGKDIDDTTFGAGKLSCKKTSALVVYGNNTLRAATHAGGADAVNTGYRAAAGEDGWGILVGSGVTAESFEDYALATQIADGTAAGQLSHVESEAHAISYVGLVLKNTLSRYFNNNSGGVVTVNEVALVASVSNYNLSIGEVLFSRDKLASAINIPDTGQLKVTYTIQLTYPA